jgi:hypothetical protein
MTKWVALALGALLALGGAIAIWNGIYYIPSEFGGAYVIAGSAAMAGGVVTFALFLLIREVQALRAGAALAAPSFESPMPLADEAPAPGASVLPEATPAPQEPSTPQEPVGQAAPAVVPPAATDSRPAPPRRFEPLRRTPLPHETTDFAQVFPPVPVESQPAPLRSFEFAARAARTRIQGSDAAPVAPATSLAATAALIGMANRPRLGPSAEIPPQETTSQETRPQEPQTSDSQAQEARNEEIRHPEAEVRQTEAQPEPPHQSADHEPQAHEPLIHEAHPPQDHGHDEAEPHLSLRDQPEPEPEPAPEADQLQDHDHGAERHEEAATDHPLQTEGHDNASAERQGGEASGDWRDEAHDGGHGDDAGGSSDDPAPSPGYAWLERALAREEGRKSPALEWLRSRHPTNLLVEPPASSPDEQRQERFAPPGQRAVYEAEHPAQADSEPLAEPVSEHDQTLAAVTAEEHSATHQDAAQPDHVDEEPATALAPAVEPEVVGRYSSGGSDYTLYADGTIDAQSEHGLYRFASMAELRAHIEAQNQQPQ